MTSLETRRIMVDVGGHIGETVEAVLDPIYGFDAVYSFEPVHECADHIRRIRDPRVKVIEAGLSNRDHDAPIYGAGGVGASIFPDAPDAVGRAELCKFLEVSQWFRKNIPADDIVYVKLNCEGSECDVLDNLLDSGEYARITQVLIDFDARKVPSQTHRVAQLKQRLKQKGYSNYSFPEQMQYGAGSHFGGIRQWLNRTGARRGGCKRRVQSLVYHLGNVVHRRHLAFYKLKVLRLTPKPVVAWYYRRVKPRAGVLASESLQSKG